MILLSSFCTIVNKQRYSYNGNRSKAFTTGTVIHMCILYPASTKSGKQLRERQQACCTHLASYWTPDEGIQDTQSCSGLRCRFREQRCICCNRERCGGEELSCRGPIVVVFWRRRGWRSWFCASDRTSTKFLVMYWIYVFLRYFNVLDLRISTIGRTRMKPAIRYCNKRLLPGTTCWW